MAEPVKRNFGIRAARGKELRCKGWRQEAILRLLENNLENAERPEDLIVYMSRARAARDWESYDRTVEGLKRLEAHQTLVMQSGKPVGIFPTQETTPLVIMANGNLVGRWTNDQSRRRLEAENLTIFPGMTAAAWQYIGSQGILQGTYETFMSIGRQHFGGDLKGRWIVTGGCGGMGGAQPLAGVLAGAAILVVDVDPVPLRRRLDTGYLQRITEDLDEALRLCLDAKAEGRAVSVGLVGNAAEILPRILERGLVPDVVTDQTEPDPVAGYYPAGLSIEETRELRRADPKRAAALALESLARHMRALLAFKRRGAIVFEYGNNMRSVVQEAGVTEAFEIESFVKLFIRPLFCEGIGPFRWIAVSGDPQDIATIDGIIEANFPADSRIVTWISKAREHVVFTGLPARIGWLGFGDRAKLATLVNDAVADGRLAGPVCFTRDHLDSGSAALPFRETEGMADGSDAVADWPLLNALLNCASGADLVALHEMGDWARCAGVTVVADGTAGAAQRLKRVFDADPGIGILRHADAGYQTAIDCARSEAFRSVIYRPE